ncbi:MAG: heterodisulfide reductase-related iron-sulfur binding cluster [Ilumatobacteraceae bacterium]
MSTASDPLHALYLDEADVRGELTRTFDVCTDCRRCVSLCASFPTLFALVDPIADHDAGRLSPSQQNEIVDACHHCSLCVIGCPAGAGLVEQPIDVPRLMLRAKAMMLAADQVGVGERISTQFIAHPDLVGRIASATAPTANRLLAAKPRRVVRTIIAKTTGLSRTRQLPSFSEQRFSTWFKRRPKVRIGKRQGKVSLFPTCLVEYQQPAIGHDLVKVYERNGVEVSLSAGRCCGAPWLHSGDVAHFTKVAEENIAILAAEIRKGNDIVVPQPTCGLVLKQDYIHYVLGSDAELVAEHTFDAAEYLMNLHRSGDSRLDTSFDGQVPTTITYHAPCHLRAQRIGLKSRDLMRLTGATIRLVQQCSGVDGLVGLRGSADALATPIGAKLGVEIQRFASDAIAGDCHLSNIVITERTGRIPQHPLQIIARAYGIAEEEPTR